MLLEADQSYPFYTRFGAAMLIPKNVPFSLPLPLQPTDLKEKRPPAALAAEAPGAYLFPDGQRPFFASVTTRCGSAMPVGNTRRFKEAWEKQPPWSKPPGNCQASVPLLLHTPARLGVGGIVELQCQQEV